MIQCTSPLLARVRRFVARALVVGVAPTTLAAQGVEFSAGVAVGGVPGRQSTYDGKTAWLAQISLHTDSLSGWRFGAGYAYLHDTGLRCCADTPAIRYGQQAVMLGWGYEFVRRVGRSASVGLDVQHAPVVSRDTRRGAIPGFTPSAVDWEASLLNASTGLTLRWQATRSVQAHVSLRTFVEGNGLSLGAAPHVRPALMFGIGNR